MPRFGLVLAGGQSRRMGRDKRTLSFPGINDQEGQSLQERALALLSRFIGQDDKPDRLDRLFLALNETQTSPYGEGVGEGVAEGVVEGDGEAHGEAQDERRNHDPGEAQILRDLYPGTGPLGALYSAFTCFPQTDWLVVPCDLPLLQLATIQSLLNQPYGEEQVRLLRHPERDQPEPLVGLWRTSAGVTVRQAFDRGERAVYKVLRTLHVAEIAPSHPDELFNVNTEEDLKRAAQLISRRAR